MMPRAISASLNCGVRTARGQSKHLRVVALPQSHCAQESARRRSVVRVASDGLAPLSGMCRRPWSNAEAQHSVGRHIGSESSRRLRSQSSRLTALAASFEGLDRAHRHRSPFADALDNRNFAKGLLSLSEACSASLWLSRPRTMTCDPGWIARAETDDAAARRRARCVRDGDEEGSALSR